MRSTTRIFHPATVASVIHDSESLNKMRLAEAKQAAKANRCVNAFGVGLYGGSYQYKQAGGDRGILQGNAQFHNRV